MKLIWLAFAAAVILTACDRRAAPLAAASAQPASLYWIGPQPGPDRPGPTLRNPYADDRQVLDEGRRLFVWYNCAGCHGDHGGGGMGPSLRDSAWVYGSGDGDIFASITEGRAYGMPAWGSKLPSDQIWKLVTYIQSMRKPYEPSPPR